MDSLDKFEQLTPEQQALLMLKLRRRSASGNSQRINSPAITPRLRNSDLPLSFAQERLWFIDQLEPGDSTYNVRRLVRLNGPLDLVALERSFNHVIDRHEVLRTTFSLVEGWPRQNIADNLTIKLVVEDLCDSHEPETELRRLAIAEAEQPFDLTRGPLLRGTVVRLGVAEHVLLVTMHHIVSDRWSMGIILRELSTLYDGYVKGEPAVLQGLPIQYADFALWQREWLGGGVLEEQLQYWRDQLADAPAVLTLPADRTRPAVLGNHGRKQRVEISASLISKLRELGHSEGATLFMTLLAAFQVLLYRYSGQRDIVVGTPIANRNRGEVEQLIGFFVNTLVTRIQ